jgi:hypothetical protein
MLDRIMKVEKMGTALHPLHKVTLWHATLKREYVAHMEPEQLRLHTLKEEILALVGEVLWENGIEKRLEELLEIEYGRGHADGHEAGFDSARDSDSG